MARQRVGRFRRFGGRRGAGPSRPSGPALPPGRVVLRPGVNVISPVPVPVPVTPLVAPMPTPYPFAVPQETMDDYYDDWESEGAWEDEADLSEEDVANSPAAQAANRYTYQMSAAGVPTGRTEFLGSTAAVAVFDPRYEAQLRSKITRAEIAANTNGLKTALVSKPGSFGVVFASDVAAAEDRLADDGWTDIEPSTHLWK